MLDPDLAQAKAMLITLKMDRSLLEHGHPFPAVVMPIRLGCSIFSKQCTAVVDAAWYRASCLTCYSNLHSYSLCCGVLTCATLMPLTLNMTQLLCSLSIQFCVFIVHCKSPLRLHFCNLCCTGQDDRGDSCRGTRRTGHDASHSYPCPGEPVSPAAPGC